MEFHNNVGMDIMSTTTTTTTMMTTLTRPSSASSSPSSSSSSSSNNNNNSNKQIKPSPNPVDTNSVTLRLQKELMSLMMSGGDLGVSAFPESENIFSWIGTIEGGKGTPYEGLSYKLSLRFPLDYPFKAPQVKFETMCFHPNVDQYGNICLDILQDKWSSAYDCRTILLSIQSLLGEPNNESPLNSYAATLWDNQEDYKKMVHKHFMDEETFES